jgi:hypothetical protein
LKAKASSNGNYKSQLMLFLEKVMSGWKLFFLGLGMMKKKKALFTAIDKLLE